MLSSLFFIAFVSHSGYGRMETSCFRMLFSRSPFFLFLLVPISSERTPEVTSEAR